MTQLLSLFNQVFGNQTKGNDLERFISAHNPTNDKDVEELTRGYLY
jgi:hypothetical protein